MAFSLYHIAKTNLVQPVAVANPPIKPAIVHQRSYDLNYYLKGALAGGICCGVTHGALCPVDVVKNPNSARSCEVQSRNDWGVSASGRR